MRRGITGKPVFNVTHDGSRQVAAFLLDDADGLPDGLRAKSGVNAEHCAGVFLRLH